MILKVIDLLEGFPNAILQTFLQHFTQFQTQSVGDN